jgi:hypothetical protein
MRIWRRVAHRHVPERAVERRELSAQVDDVEIHECAAKADAVLFGRAYEPATDPASLLGRVDRQHSKIAAIAARLDVDRAHQGPWRAIGPIVGDDQERRVRPSKSVANVGVGGAAAVEDVRLDDIGEIDHSDQLGDVGEGSAARHHSVLE